MFKDAMVYLGNQVVDGKSLMSFPAVHKTVVPVLSEMMDAAKCDWHERAITPEWEHGNENRICIALTQYGEEIVSGIIAACVLATQGTECLLDLLDYDNDTQTLMTSGNTNLLTGRVLGYFEAMAALYQTEESSWSMYTPANYSDSRLWLVPQLLQRRGGPSEAELKKIEGRLSNAIATFVKGPVLHRNDGVVPHSQYLDLMFADIYDVRDDNWDHRSLENVILDQLTMKDWARMTPLERLEKRAAESRPSE